MIMLNKINNKISQLQAERNALILKEIGFSVNIIKNRVNITEEDLNESLSIIEYHAQRIINAYARINNIDSTISLLEGLKEK
jgi:hypothetical protein